MGVDMKRFMALFVLFLVSLSLSAVTDADGNKYKTTIVEFSLLDPTYTNVSIGFRDKNDQEIKSIDLKTSDLHAESDTFKVFWEIVSSTSFDLYLKGIGPLLNNGYELDWRVEAITEAGERGAVYLDGISSDDPSVYITGGLLHNHLGTDFRDSNEQDIRIVTDDFVDLSSGNFGETELRIEIVSI